MNDSLIKKPDGKPLLKQNNKVALPGLHARAAAAPPSNINTAITKTHRIGLLLDLSGSMNSMDGAPQSKIELLRQAYDIFAQGCDFATTAVAVKIFPRHDGTHDLPLNDQKALVLITGMNLETGGGTPMHTAMQSMIEENPISRAILISDGEADNPALALQQAGDGYKEMGIPVDTVHIGSSAGGEDLLARIAQITGGIYMKFTDVEAFAKAFSFLTPAKRSLLLSGAVRALDIGAREIKLGGQ